NGPPAIGAFGSNPAARSASTDRKLPSCIAAANRAPVLSSAHSAGTATSRNNAAGLMSCVDDPPCVRVHAEGAVLTIAAHRQLDRGHDLPAQIGGAVRLLPRAHAIEKVVHVQLVAFVAHAFQQDLVLAPFLPDLVLERRLGDDAAGREIT